MKFYYNGQLVRTSKTHEYHYGILNIDGTRVSSCHGTLKDAEKEMAKAPASCRTFISECKAAIHAIENGKTTFPRKICGRTYYEPTKYTKEEYEGMIERTNARIAELGKRKIVELEAKA